MTPEQSPRQPISPRLVGRRLTAFRVRGGDGGGSDSTWNTDYEY